SNDIGLGSRDTYRKAKFIAENADSSTIAKLDNEEISIHKAYTELKESFKEKEKLLHQETEKRKRAEQEIFAARKSEQLTRKQLAELEQQEPQIVEREVVKEVEIAPNNLLNRIDELKDENAELKDTADFYKQKADALLKNPEDLREEESTLNYLANTNVHTIIAHIDSFIQDVSISALMRGSIANANDLTKENLRQRIQMLRELTNDLDIAMTGRKIN
ncbi:chromosome partitioning protein ParB, partial [Bacillus cereus]